MSDKWIRYKKCDDFRVAAPASVQDMIEIKSIADNGIFEIGAGGIYTKTYQFTDINYITASEEEQLQMLDAWCRWLNTNHEKFKITMNNKNRDMLRLKQDVLFAHRNDALDTLRDAYNEIIEDNLYEGRQGIEKEMYITVRCETAKNYEEAKVYFNTLETNMTRDFQALGSRLIPLDAVRRLKIIHDIYRFGKEDEFRFSFGDLVSKGFDFKNVIASTYLDFTVGDDFFKCDDKYMSALYIRDYPSRLKDTFLTDAFANNIRMISSMDVVPIDREDAEKRIKDLYMNVQKIIRKQNKKRIKSKDFSSEISYSVQMEQDEVKELMEDVRNGNEHLFWTNVIFLIIADSEQQLKEHTEMLLQYTKNRGVTVEYLYNMQREAFNTVLPIGVRQVSTGWTMETKSMRVLYPFHVMELMMPGGIYYGINRESKNPCIGNRKRLMNANGIFFGTTGSGKTTQAKNEIMQTLLKTNDDIIIVDPKGDYGKLVEAGYGVRIELATTATNYINPLAYYGAGYRETIANEKAEIIHAIFGICKKEPLDAIEDNVVDKALVEVYKNDTMYPGYAVEHTLWDLYNELQKIADDETCNAYERDAAIRLHIFLERFVKGPLSIFAHETNINVNNRLIVFDLSRLGAVLWDLGMLVMLEHIQERIYKNYYENRATWLYIDEMHVLLAHPSAQAYLLGLWKKVRSFGGLCTGITQILGDIEINNTTKGLLETSEFVSLFKSDVSANDSMIKNLGISEAQVKYITSESSPGKGLLRFGQTVVPFDMTLPKDSIIYEITDTNAHDKFERSKGISQ